MDDSTDANDGPSWMQSGGTLPSWRDLSARVADCFKIRQREILRRECTLLSRLHHPNIIQFLGVQVELCFSLPDYLNLRAKAQCDLSGCMDSHGTTPDEEDCLVKEYLGANTSKYDAADCSRIRYLELEFTFSLDKKIQQLLDALHTTIQAIGNLKQLLSKKCYSFSSIFCPVMDVHNDINVEIFHPSDDLLTLSVTIESTESTGVCYSGQPVLWKGEDSSLHQTAASQEMPPEPHCPGPPPLWCFIAGILQLLQLAVAAEILLISVILLAQANNPLHEAAVAVAFVSLLSTAWCLRTVVAVFSMVLKDLCTIVPISYRLCSPRSYVKYVLCVVALAAVVLYCLVAVCAASTSSRRSKSSFVFAVTICMCPIATSLPLDQPDDHAEVHIRGARSAGGAIFAPLEGAPNTGYSVTIALGKNNPQEVYTT